MHPLTCSTQARTPPKRNWHPRERTGGRAVSMEVPCGAGPGWKSPGCPPPRGFLVHCPPSVGGGRGECVRGPKSCPLTPGEVRRTSTLERGSQWARNQVPTPAWGQARHQLRCRPSRTAQRPAALRTTAWQRRRSVHGSAAPRPGVWNQHPPGDAVHSHYPRLLPREDPGTPPVEHPPCRQPLRGWDPTAPKGPARQSSHGLCSTKEGTSPGQGRRSSRRRCGGGCHSPARVSEPSLV